MSYTAETLRVSGSNWLASSFGVANPIPMANCFPALTEKDNPHFMPQNDDHIDQPHIPVMLPEVLAALTPKAGEVFVDATFGAGGYTTGLLDTGAKVIAIDRDPDAIAAGAKLVENANGNLILEHGRFANLDAIVKATGISEVDGVVADIGVSSMQIDQAERGFSFQKDGPLDMRMEQTGLTAADVVNTFDRSDLTRIIGILGDERKASLISAEICKRRETKLFDSTLDLANHIYGVVGKKAKDKIHPATRTFQALRIFVNRELEELADALLAAEAILKPGGRLVIVTFHSLEDRLVKRFFQERAREQAGSRHLPQVGEKILTFDQPARGAAAASKDEAAVNPRARSAKLRSGIRTDAEAPEFDRKIFGLPRLADHKAQKTGHRP